MVNIQNPYDKQLLEGGRASFSTYVYNEFVMYVARKENKFVTDITDEFMLNYHKDLKIEYFSSICEEEILAGFVHTNGHTYKTSRDDQFNMFAEYIMTKDNPNVTTIKFKAHDVGEQIEHTKEEFQSVVMSGFGHVKSRLSKLDKLRKDIKACATDPEIFAIKWTDDV